MPATDSLTATIAATSSAVATLTDPSDGYTQLDHRGFRVKQTAAGVSISKASSFGGSQAALVFPLSVDDARVLAQTLTRMLP